VKSVHSPSRRLVDGYVAWLIRHRWLVLVASILVAGVGGYLALRMPVHSDLATLLPPQRPSVRALKVMQQRVQPFGSVQVVIDATTPEQAARASDEMSTRIRTLPPELVRVFSSDDSVKNQFVWNNRFMLAPTDELRETRDELKRQIEQAKLEANPLYISLDDPKEPVGENKLETLEARLEDIENKAKQPKPWASRDGHVRVLIIQTAFASSETKKSNRLLGALSRMAEETKSITGPGTSIGFAGNVTFGMYEHDSVLDGMAKSGIITVLLVAFGLLLYYRSGKLVLGILYALLVGVAATAAVAWLTVGHLNVMTAFLFAIVVGNGINAGLILAARFIEERQKLDDLPAISEAVAGSMRGTVAAAATASVAYVSLLVADFRGFRQFGAIAGVGILLTWITTYTVLPALLSVIAKRLPQTRPSGLGNVLAAILPERKRRLMLVIGAGITLVALVITTMFIGRGPFAHDWRDLQSSSREIEQTRNIDRRGQSAFDPNSIPSGGAFQFAIATQRREDVAPLVKKIRAENAARSPEQRWLDSCYSMDDLVPSDQAEKQTLLADIRRLLDDEALQASLTDEERARLERLRPPQDIPLIRDEDVPYELAWPFIERDGTRGKLIVLRGARRFKAFNVDHRLEFAGEVRRIELPPGAVVAGEALVFAEIIETMEGDALEMISFAVIGSALMVLLLVGFRRHGFVTLVCGFSGVLVMIAACATIGVKVHFLDLIALPITIGIGIEYAVNLVARSRQRVALGSGDLLRTTGGTVLVCSFTTSVGYGTLLLSANGGIRAFGLAALLGEIACIAMALVVAPAWLSAWHARATRSNPR
jgi:uncharacterized protein